MKASIEYLLGLRERLETTYRVVEDDSIYNVNIIIPLFEYESQLLAIIDLLIRQYKADISLEEEIAKYDKAINESSGDYSEYDEVQIDLRNELIQKSIFQDAAHSMSAIGMLAPFTESIFFNVFKGICEELFVSLEVNQVSKRLDRECKKAWDCHYYLNENNKFEKNLVNGILQLNSDLGLARFLPRDLEKFLIVLFAFRNANFHCGFEWPIEERDKFQKRIIDEIWPKEWIKYSLINSKPWIFYLTDEFIAKSIEIIVNTLIGISKYVEELIADIAVENENICPT